MKKLTAILLTFILVLSLGACTEESKPAAPTQVPEATAAPTAVPTEPVSANVSALKGPTGMGMAKLMEDGYEITLASAPDNVTAEIIKGAVDIAAVPINLAAVLYKKTGGEIQIAAVNTLGVLHILENGNTVNSIPDKVVYECYVRTANYSILQTLNPSNAECFLFSFICKAFLFLLYFVSITTDKEICRDLQILWRFLC